MGGAENAQNSGLVDGKESCKNVITATMEYLSNFEFAKSAELRKKFLVENSSLLQELFEVEEQLSEVDEEIRVIRLKLFSMQRWLDQEASDTLAQLEAVLGYKVGSFNLLADGTVEITFIYKGSCYAKFHHMKRYELLEIFPYHPNLPTIQELFRESQDTTGLLGTLKTYFDNCLAAAAAYGQ